MQCTWHVLGLVNLRHWCNAR